MHAVVFNFGALFFANRFKNAPFFFVHMERMRMTKNCFSPVKGKQFSAQVHRNVDSGANIQCVQKRGAYVAQHKHPIIERVHAGHSWTLHFPLFSRPIPHNLKIPETPIFTAFRDDFVGVLAPPPKPSTRIFSGHNKITAKVRFVNKVGAHLVSRKRFWNPYFYSVSRDKIENASFFCPFHARFRSQNRSQKPSPWGAAPVFAQTVRLWKKPKNILTPPSWPYLNDPPTRLTTKWKHQSPHAKTGSQDMKLKNQHDHTAAKKQEPKMRKINKTKKQTSAKLQRNRSTPPPKKKTRTQNRTERIPKMLAQETSWTERRLFTKHQNNDITINKKKQRVPYSLETYSKYI